MADTLRFKVAVVGGGPAGLMAAEILSAGRSGAGDARATCDVTIYDRMPTLGRKFLMAGRGGLNLTHSEDLALFLGRYGDRAALLQPAIAALPPTAMRDWCEGLGQPTFVGTSGRVFPTAMKASPLLRAWLRRLGAAGVQLKTRHRWTGWTGAGQLEFETPDGVAIITPDATILALGGASWPTLGSDAAWVVPLQRAGVQIAAFQPANCGFRVSWSKLFQDRFQGQPLKRIAIGYGEHQVRGEAILTADGIEGGAVYALSAELRRAIKETGHADIAIDVRPDLCLSGLTQRLAAPRGKQSLSSFLRKAGQLSPTAIGLLQEAAIHQSQPLGQLAAEVLAALIKSIPVRLNATAPIDKAISSAGGVAFAAINAGYMLTSRPGVFVAGEMLDWEAPTGGYLLQACLATGATAGLGALGWLEQDGFTPKRHCD